MSPPFPLYRCRPQTLLRPILCVIIDTEEEFDWESPFSRANISVKSLKGIPRGQSIFHSFGAKPTYLLDYPVATDPDIGDILGPYLESSGCLVGAQLHTWVTPPFEELVCPFNSYPSNLDADLERRKLEQLTRRIEKALNVSPRVYKAGRYGIDLRREGMLRSLGYEVDTSVLPFRNYSGLGGGPNFFGYPDQPFWTAPDRKFLYVPVTQSLVGPMRVISGSGIDRLVFSYPSCRLHLPGILARLRILERITLTPEGQSVADMRRLTRTMINAGQRVFALSLHSPSLVAGGTPYVTSESELSRFLDRIKRYLEFFVEDVGGDLTDPLSLKSMLGAEPDL